MKKNFLSFLLLALSANALSAVVEKDGIIVQYERAAYFSCLSAQPYQIEIQNNSDKSIVFDSSIISNLIFDQRAIEASLWENVTFSKGADGIFEAIPKICIAWFIEEMTTCFFASWINETVKEKIIGKRILPTLIAAYLVFKPIKSFAQKIYVTHLKTFRGTVTLKPGESIERVFWLRIPRDQIKIDFDAIKVLK